MARYRLHGPVQEDVESAALTRAILTFLDHVDGKALRSLFAGALLIATLRKPDGRFSVSLVGKRPAGLRGYRTFCRGDPDRVARILDRDPTEISRLASVVQPLTLKELESWKAQQARSPSAPPSSASFGS